MTTSDRAQGGQGTGGQGSGWAGRAGPGRPAQGSARRGVLGPGAPQPASAPSVSVDPAGAGGASRRRHRRDRHGRGLRGPLLPAALPAARTRGEAFDDLVLDAVEDLERRWRSELSGIEFAVEDVPPDQPVPQVRREVPLGRCTAGDRRSGPRVVLYRRPITARAVDEADLADLVHEVVVEQVASALGRSPEEIDPT